MKNEIRSPHPRKDSAPARPGRCIALIDSNYMSWLTRQSSEAGAEPETFNRQFLMPVLAHALKQSGLGVEVQRVYWYTDAADNQFPQDQIVRHLDSAAGEPSDVVLQAMSLDISRLAERHACEHLLIASDDDRLTPVIDEAQLHGVMVYLLADESARHMDQLVNEDPAWCRLLGQADRRVLFLPPAARENGPQRAAAPAQDPEVVRVKLQEVVDLWWDDEPEDLREDLRDELRGSHGIPQEVDRHMLLRVRRALDRPLSFPEKKMLREMVRGKVLGVSEEGMPA